MSINSFIEIDQNNASDHHLIDRKPLNFPSNILSRMYVVETQNFDIPNNLNNRATPIRAIDLSEVGSPMEEIDSNTPEPKNPSPSYEVRIQSFNFLSESDHITDSSEAPSRAFGDDLNTPIDIGQRGDLEDDSRPSSQNSLESPIKDEEDIFIEDTSRLSSPKSQDSSCNRPLRRAHEHFSHLPAGDETPYDCEILDSQTPSLRAFVILSIIAL